MPAPEHNETLLHLQELDGKLERLVEEIHDMRVELHASVMVHETKLNQHEKELVLAFNDIQKLEDRSWRSSSAIVIGAISFIGTASLAILTFLL